MSLLVVRLYAEVAILLAVALGLAAGGRALGERLFGPQAARSWLRLGYLLLVAAVALPIVARVVLRPEAFFPAPMQVSSGTGGEGLRLAVALAAPAPSRAPARGVGEGPLAALAVSLVAASLWGGGRLLRDGFRLSRLCRSAIPVRRAGRVTVAVSDVVGVPFSVCFGGHARVVLPEAFVLAPGHLRLVVAHELAHVRAGDTTWAYATAVVRALFPWHPAALLLGRWVARLQELACDERVSRRGDVSPRSYAECLVWAAELAAGVGRVPAVAVPMLEGSRAFMERRITMVMSTSVSKRRRQLLVPVLGAATLGALALAATVSHGAVADRQISASEAQAIADDLARAGGLRVPVDAIVMEELDRILGAPEARAKLREALARLPGYRATGEEALRRHKLPLELLAIPLVESRLQALPEAQNRMRSAGVWQFIPVTARRYGMTVEGAVDERLDAAKEADAAARFLADLFADFRDWPLAIAAYNQGPGKVRAVMTATGVKDAATLVKRGSLGRYSSQVLAAMLLLHRPALLD